MNINATQQEVDLATELYCAISQKATEAGIRAEKVHALLTVALYTTTDPKVHVDGVEDGRDINELMQEYLMECGSE